jgi:hypothetical protein
LSRSSRLPVNFTFIANLTALPIRLPVFETYKMARLSALLVVLVATLLSLAGLSDTAGAIVRGPQVGGIPSTVYYGCVYDLTLSNLQGDVSLSYRRRRTAD